MEGVVEVRILGDPLCSGSGHSEEVHDIDVVPAKSDAERSLLGFNERGILNPRNPPKPSLNPLEMTLRRSF
jgi:hypothetical protein